MTYSRVMRICEPEEFGLGLLAEETTGEEHLKLMLVDKIQLIENHPPSSIMVDDAGNGEAEHIDNKSGAHSPLAIYLKTISRIPLLKEEEERVLAKRLKESEEECKNLVILWKHLFKKEFLGIFAGKQREGISKKIQSFNGTFHLFDDLVKLERERKEINHALQKRAYSSKTQEEIQEKLYKVEANISKCIAKISRSKMIINGIIRNLKGIPHSKKYTKKRCYVEQALRRILKQVDKLSREINDFKNELVKTNQRLVISIAKRYSHHGLDLPDLIQEGNLGLIRAIDTYDYRRGHRLITYATWWIRQAIIRALDCKSRTIRTPIYINAKLSQILKVSNQLLQECEMEPTLGEIAKKTNTDLESVEKVMKSFKNPVSLDAFVEGKGEGIIVPSIDQETVTVLEQAIYSNLSQTIDVVLSSLTPREKEMVKLRFGIGEDHDHTLGEIAGKFKLSRERIRQILETALNKLRNPGHMIKLKDFMNLN